MERTLIAQGPVDVTVGPIAWVKVVRGQTDVVPASTFQAADAIEMGWTPLYAIPDRWRLVPSEATRKMLDAAERVDEDGYHAMWDAMLATAPLPPNALANAPASAGD